MSERAASHDARPSLVRIERSAVELNRDEGDAKHIPVGAMTALWRSAFSSNDRQLEVGYWEFSGGMRTTPFDGRELVMIVLSGSGTVVSDGGKIGFGEGDVVVHESPVPEKTMSSEGGFSAVYVTRFRTPEDLRAARPS